MLPLTRLSLLLAILLPLSHLAAGVNFENVRYDTQIVKECVADKPECCRFSPPCMLKYSLSGVWSRELDTTPTKPACTAECARQFDKCEDRCRMLTMASEMRSNDFCKCVVTSPKTLKGLRKRCVKKCKKARKDCVSGCVGSSCIISALTTAEFEETIVGKCGQTCKKPGPVPIVKCPVVGSLTQ